MDIPRSEMMQAYWTDGWEYWESHPSVWDINKYREEHENEDHWELRKRFMERWKSHYSEERLVCLSRVFANMEWLGCSYPIEVMQEVARLSHDVIEEYRNSCADKLKRKFITASHLYMPLDGKKSSPASTAVDATSVGADTKNLETPPPYINDVSYHHGVIPTDVIPQTSMVKDESNFLSNNSTLLPSASETVNHPVDPIDTSCKLPEREYNRKPFSAIQPIFSSSTIVQGNTNTSFPTTSQAVNHPVDPIDISWKLPENKFNWKPHSATQPMLSTSNIVLVNTSASLPSGSQVVDHPIDPIDISWKLPERKSNKKPHSATQPMLSTSNTVLDYTSTSLSSTSQVVDHSVEPIDPIDISWKLPERKKKLSKPDVQQHKIAPCGALQKKKKKNKGKKMKVGCPSGVIPTAVIPPCNMVMDDSTSSASLTSTSQAISVDTPIDPIDIYWKLPQKESKPLKNKVKKKNQSQRRKARLLREAAAAAAAPATAAAPVIIAATANSSSTTYTPNPNLQFGSANLPEAPVDTLEKAIISNQMASQSFPSVTTPASIAVARSGRQIKSALRPSKSARFAAKKARSIETITLEGEHKAAQVEESSGVVAATHKESAAADLVAAIVTDTFDEVDETAAAYIMEALTNQLLKEAKELHANSTTIRPIFTGCPIYIHGQLRLSCVNEPTLTWLKETVPKIRLPSGEGLVAKRLSEISVIKRISCGILLPGRWDDTKDVSKALRYQNGWAQVHRWLFKSSKIQKNAHDEFMTYILVMIPEDLIPTIIAKDRQVAFCLGTAYIKFFRKGKSVPKIFASATVG